MPPAWSCRSPWASLTQRNPGVGVFEQPARSTLRTTHWRFQPPQSRVIISDVLGRLWMKFRMSTDAYRAGRISETYKGSYGQCSQEGWTSRAADQQGVPLRRSVELWLACASGFSICFTHPCLEVVGFMCSLWACPMSLLPCVSPAVMELVSASYEMGRLTLGLKSCLRNMDE